LTIADGDTQSVAIAVTDENTAGLTFTANSDDADVAVVAVDGGGNFTVTATGNGTATIVLTAEDEAGQSDSESFQVFVPEVVVNIAPVIGARTPSAAVLTIEDGTSQAVTVDIDDEDPASLTFTVSSSDTTVASVVVDNAGDLTITGTGEGTATVSLIVTDNGGLSATLPINVLVPAPAAVNQPPEIVSRDPASRQSGSVCRKFGYFSRCD